MSSKRTTHGFITGEQATILRTCADKPGSFEALNTRACNALERRGLVEIEIDAVKLTATGKAALAEMGAKRTPAAKAAPTTKPKSRGGGRPKRHGADEVERERPAAPTSNPTLADLRRIRGEVAQKLQALDETIELVAALA